MKKEKEKIFDIEELRKNMSVEEIKEDRNRKRKKKKKKGKIKFIAFLLVVTVLVLMLTPIFTVQWFEVTGNVKISDSRILKASGIETGDNLFRFNVKRTKDKIRTITQIDEIRILRWFPSGIKIRVTERVPVAALKTKNGYLTTDIKGKLIEAVKETHLPVVENINTTTLKPGDSLKEEQIEIISQLVEVAKIVEDSDLNDRMTEFGIDKSGNYKFLIDGNKNVVLGEETRIDYKLKMLKAVVDELSPAEEGTIDLSKEGQALYSP